MKKNLKWVSALVFVIISSIISAFAVETEVSSTEGASSVVVSKAKKKRGHKAKRARRAHAKKKRAEARDSAPPVDAAAPAVPVDGEAH